MSECSMVLKEFENLKRNALKLLKDAKVLISDSYQMRKGYLYINTPRSVHNVLDIRDMLDDLKDLANGVFKSVAKMKDSCNAYDARNALKTAVDALETAVKIVNNLAGSAIPNQDDDLIAKAKYEITNLCVDLDNLEDSWASRKPITESKIEKVRDAYIKKFPDDELGLEINPRVTFKSVWNAMQKGEDFYEIVGDEIDTVIRERIFAMMSEKFHIPYDDIYDLWILNYRKSKNEI